MPPTSNGNNPTSVGEPGSDCMCWGLRAHWPLPSSIYSQTRTDSWVYAAECTRVASGPGIYWPQLFHLILHLFHLRFYTRATNHRQTQHNVAERPPSTFKLQGSQNERGTQGSVSGPESFASILIVLRDGCPLGFTLYIINISLSINTKGRFPQNITLLKLHSLTAEGTWPPCLDWYMSP